MIIILLLMMHFQENKVKMMKGISIDNKRSIKNYFNLILIAIKKLYIFEIYLLINVRKTYILYLFLSTYNLFLFLFYN